MWPLGAAGQTLGVVGLSPRLRTLRPVALAGAALFVLAGCELGQKVDERMHRPEVVDRFLVADDGSDTTDADSTDPDTTTTTQVDGPVSVDGSADADDGPAPARPTTSSVPAGVELQISGWWKLEEELPEGTLDLRADIDVDLYPIDDEALVDLGLIDEADAGRFRLTRWYRAAGSVRFDLIESQCRPAPHVDDCNLVRATDGSIEGIVAVDGGVARLGLEWQGLGAYGSQKALPEVTVEITDSSGFRTTRSLTSMGDSIATRVVGTPVELIIGDPDRLLRAIGFSAEGELQIG